MASLYEGEPANKRRRQRAAVVGQVTAAEQAAVVGQTAAAEQVTAAEQAEWDAFWDLCHEGLGADWGDGMGNDEDGEPLHEDFVTFRNDVLPDTDTASADTRHAAAQLASVIQDKGVVETRRLDLELATLLVEGIVKAKRSVRHIIVRSRPESVREWLDTNIHLHGEGGQVIADASGSSMHIDAISDRKLNSRTLLIDEVGDKSLQDKVTAAGGMVVVVGG